MNVQEIVNNRYGKGIAQCSNEEIYYALLEMTKSTGHFLQTTGIFIAFIIV